MFTITARVRSSRVEGQPGTVFYNIRNDEGERCIATGIHASREELFTVYKEKLSRGLGVLYRLIEELSTGADTASLDAVASRFREVIEGEHSDMNSTQSSSPIVVRRDLAVIGRGFEDSFLIVSSEEENGADDSISSFLSERIRLARSEGRQSMARSYRSLQKALDDFRPRIRFGDFCPALLGEFENYLKGKELAESSVSFYNRTLRSVLRHAESQDLITTSPDWFRSINTSIHSSSSAEHSDILDVDVLRRLAVIDLDKRPELELVRDVFMFCFHARGMELVDAAALTGDELCDGVLYYREAWRWCPSGRTVG